MKLFRKIVVTAFVFAAFFFTLTGGTVSALEIVLEPSNAKREVGKNVRVYIYADNAENLISMGVKVSFDPAVLQVDEGNTAKSEENADTGWVMDADGDASTSEDQYRPTDVEIDNLNGTVTMLGGNINGASTTGFSGKVLLGWVAFHTTALGSSDIAVDLAKYHPNHPDQTFSNFVGRDGTVDEPTNLGILGKICVVENACEGDINNNGAVDRFDSLFLGKAFNSSAGDDNYKPAADLNGDGRINRIDSLIFTTDFNRGDCGRCGE